MRDSDVVTEMPYNALTYIDVDPQQPAAAAYGTWCTVTWRPRDGGRLHHACAPFLDGMVATGVVTLGCGLDQWCGEVGLVLTEDEKWAIRDLVDPQLANHPWAEIGCRAGRARIELCPRPRWADGIGEVVGDEGWLDA